MIRVLDSAGSTLVEWGRQQQQSNKAALAIQDPLAVLITGKFMCAGMNNREVLEQTQKGYRMAKSSGIVDGVYEMMLQCWDKAAEKRPTFEHLFMYFDDYFISTEPNYKESD